MHQLKITKSITNRQNLSVEKYLTDISKIPILPVEEEVELAHRIQAGDQLALEKLTQSNLRFVVSVAKQYQHNGLSLSDLINEGNVGLIKAARRFDPSRGFKFISYAVWWIRQSILQAIIEYSRLVRMPVNKTAPYHKVNEAISELIQVLEREPTPEEIAEKLDITLKSVQHILTASRKHVSFDAPVGNEEDGTSLIDLMIQDDEFLPDEHIMSQSISEEMQLGLNALAPREYEIIARFYGLNNHVIQTLEEIANDFNLSKERVRQIKDRSLLRLKRSYTHQMMNKK
ncbi:MAG TPA: RNA polymerase sigma factor RpoD/SigA [Saprospiraceae bacterium]|nr:RNA polymerase sigma factor RpoD/SigA [Saprospiraceae bacterium]